MNTLSGIDQIYDDVKDILDTLEIRFNDLDEYIGDAVSEGCEESYYLNKLENWAVTTDVTLDTLQNKLEGLKILRNKIDALYSAAVIELNCDRAKLEIIKTTSDALRS